MQVHLEYCYIRGRTMKFCKLLRYDLKNGIGQKLLIYLLSFVVCVIFMGSFYFNFVSRSGEFAGEKSPLTIANLLFYLFQGKEPFSPEMGNAFVFPVVWLLLFLLPAYITLGYPFQNLTRQGIQVIMRIEKRKYWWLSKCAWVGCCTILYFALCYLAATLFCLVFGIDISFQYAEYVNAEMLDMQLEHCTEGQVMMLVVILPVMTSLAINLLQLCLGFFFQRVYCFVIISVILFVSTYFHTPIAIGNFAMVKRSIYCVENGMNFTDGLLIDSMVIAASIIVGLVRINKYDILKKNC